MLVQMPFFYLFSIVGMRVITHTRKTAATPIYKYRAICLNSPKESFSKVDPGVSQGFALMQQGHRAVEVFTNGDLRMAQPIAMTLLAGAANHPGWGASSLSSLRS